jgi:hypothetical protein
MLCASYIVRIAQHANRVCRESYDMRIAHCANRTLCESHIVRIVHYVMHLTYTTTCTYNVHFAYTLRARMGRSSPRRGLKPD